MEHASITQAGQPAHDYKVTENTAALFDCIVAASNLHAQILKALERCDALTDNSSEEYTAAVNAITNKLWRDTRAQIDYNLADTRNAASAAPQL